VIELLFLGALECRPVRVGFHDQRTNWPQREVSIHDALWLERVNEILNYVLPYCVGVTAEFIILPNWDFGAGDFLIGAGA
jgi:hypothetical protein